MIAIGIILGVIVLFLLIPVGVYARYDGDTRVRAIVGPLRFQILPAKPKTKSQLDKAEKKKAKKAQKKAEKKEKAKAKKLVQKDPEPPKPKEPLPDKIKGLLPFAKLAVNLLGSVFRRVKVKKLTVHVRFGNSDKADLAETYGKIMAVIWSMGPILGQAFRVKRSDISVVPDFLSDKTEVEAEIDIRYFVFDLLGIALKYGFRGIKLLLQKKKQEKLLLDKQSGKGNTPNSHKNLVKKAV